MLLTLAGYLATLPTNAGDRQVIYQQVDVEVASARNQVEREAA